MIVLIVFHFDYENQKGFYLPHNQTENSHYDHIPVKLKGTRNLFPRALQGGLNP